MRHWSIIIAGGLIVACAAASATAQVSYLPLATGNTWTYSSPIGDEVKLITGQEHIVGEDVWVMDYVASPTNGALENYWTVDAEGDVYLWGFWRGWGRAYVPPIKMVNAPMSVGQVWATNTSIYELRSGEFIGTHVFAFEVMHQGVYSMPAGDFPGFSIGDAGSFAIRRGDEQYSVSGELLEPTTREGMHWWSLGVGEIQYDADEVYSLASYALDVVATEGRTWSGVKALFE